MDLNLKDTVNKIKDFVMLGAKLFDKMLNCAGLFLSL